jgi:hypothetical protein
MVQVHAPSTLSILECTQVNLRALMSEPPPCLRDAPHETTNSCWVIPEAETNIAIASSKGVLHPWFILKNLPGTTPVYQHLL